MPKPKTGRTTPLMIRLTEAEHSALRWAAEKIGETKSAFVRLAVRRHVKRVKDGRE